jgi:hypothetical protein
MSKYIYPTYEIDIKMAVLPELVLYYVGITSAVKVGGHFDAYVEKLKWIYIARGILPLFNCILR